MFVKSVRHLARSGPPCCTSTSTFASRTSIASAAAPITAATTRQAQHQQQQHFHRHQRRHSSSKTSSSSAAGGGPKGSEQPASPAVGERRPTSRLARQKSKEAAAAELALKTKADGAVLNVPAVPPTTHLQLQDVAISSFFSLHRPISVTAALPTSSSIEAFNAIFEPPKPIKPNDVIFTLSNALNALESAGKGERDLRWEILQQSSSNADASRRGGATPTPEQYAQQLQKLTQTFRPFNVPPPPRPFTETSTTRRLKAGNGLKSRKSSLTSRRARKSVNSVLEEGQPRPEVHEPVRFEQRHRSSRRTRPSRLSTASPRTPTFFTMNMTAHHIPTLRGRKRFSLTNTSSQQHRREAQSVDASSPAGAEQLIDDQPQSSQQRPIRVFLISVKRQRKLKMKKHKYKKLMKRTRNLRRREGRL